MLFLTRKEGEMVNIYTMDGLIQVHVKSFRNGQVRLGVDAPSTVQIMRDEIDDGLAAFSFDKNATIPQSIPQKSHRPFGSRVIQGCINFLNSLVNTSSAKSIQ